jgi:hypothetical protein
MLHAVNHAVPRAFDRREDRLRLQPVQKVTHRRAVIGGYKTSLQPLRSGGIMND